MAPFIVLSDPLRMAVKAGQSVLGWYISFRGGRPLTGHSGRGL